MDTGTDLATGKRRQRRIGPFRSRREAELAPPRRCRKRERDRLRDAPAVTLAEYLREEWLPAREVRGLKPTTLASYRWICESDLIPRLGQVQLRKLAPPDVVAFLDRFSKEPGRGGTRRSARTIALTHRVLSLALAHAVRAGTIVRNPAEGAREDLPRGEAPAEREVWTLEQLAAFLDSTVSDPLYALAPGRHHWSAARGALWPALGRRRPGLYVAYRPALPGNGPWSPDGLNSENERRATDDRARRVHGRPPR